MSERKKRVEGLLENANFTIAKRFLKGFPSDVYAYFEKPALLLSATYKSVTHSSYVRALQPIRKAILQYHLSEYGLEEFKEILPYAQHYKATAIALRLLAACELIYGDDSDDTLPLLLKMLYTSGHTRFGEIAQVERLTSLSQVICINDENSSNQYIFLFEASDLETRLMKEAFKYGNMLQRCAIGVSRVQEFFRYVPYHADSMKDYTLDYLKGQMVLLKQYTEEESRYRSYNPWLSSFYGTLISRHKHELPSDLTDALDPKDFDKVGYFDSVLNGFHVIRHSRYSSHPTSDRWRVIPDETSQTSEHHDYYCDFSGVTNPLLKTYLKTFIWDDIGRHTVRPAEYRTFIRACIEIDAALHFPTKLTEIFCAELQKYVLRFFPARMKSRYLQFLQRMLAITDWPIEKSGLRFLKIRAEKKKTASQYVPRYQDIDLCMQYLKKQGETNPADMLVYLFLLLEQETTLRPSSIERLSIHDLHTNPSDEKTLTFWHKTSDGPSSIAITPKAAQIFLTAVAVGKQFREDCNTELQDFVFIAPAKNGRYARLCSDTINKRLSRVCTILKISRLTPKDFRKTAIAKINGYAIKTGLTDLEEAALSNHLSLSVLRKHYSPAPDFAKLLSIAHRCEIDPAVIKGTVTREKSTLPLAEAGIGHCARPTCGAYTPCITCPNLISDLDDIPPIEAAISSLDEIISDDNIFDHEKDFAASRKKVLLSLLARLYELKGDTYA